MINFLRENEKEINLLRYICDRFEQKQADWVQSPAEVCNLPHQCLTRLHTSARDCTHPSACFCLKRSHIFKTITSTLSSAWPSSGIFSCSTRMSNSTWWFFYSIDMRFVENRKYRKMAFYIQFFLNRYEREMVMRVHHSFYRHAIFCKL